MNAEVHCCLQKKTRKQIGQSIRMGKKLLQWVMQAGYYCFSSLKAWVCGLSWRLWEGEGGVMIAVIHSHSPQPLSAEITAVSVGPQPTDGSCPAPNDSLITVKRKSIGIRLDLCPHTLNRPWQRAAAFLSTPHTSARISSCFLSVLTRKIKQPTMKNLTFR